MRAAAWRTHPEVIAVSLIGSVARAPWKEVPRFAPYRRARVANAVREEVVDSALDRAHVGAVAGPATKVKSVDAKGGNLVKDVPYPIFLPVLVQTILDVYPHFSGAERLKRLGGQVGDGSRDPGKDQHGAWGLVPSSVGLVVLRFAQLVARDERGEFRDEFRRFTEARPPLYRTSWMYGGNVLLFYRAGDERPDDGETVIDGMECKVPGDGQHQMRTEGRDSHSALASALRTALRRTVPHCGVQSRPARLASTPLMAM